MIYVLDTDHVSLDQRGDRYVRARVAEAGPAAVAISVITIEEQLRGWLAATRAATTAMARARAYARLRLTLEYFASTTILDFTEQADARVATLRQQGIRIGTQDLRIAACALEHDATVVTRNRADFGQIPGLLMVDWSLP